MRQTNTSALSSFAKSSCMQCEMALSVRLGQMARSFFGLNRAPVLSCMHTHSPWQCIPIGNPTQPAAREPHRNKHSRYYIFYILTLYAGRLGADFLAEVAERVLQFENLGIFGCYLGRQVFDFGLQAPPKKRQTRPKRASEMIEPEIGISCSRQI